MDHEMQSPTPNQQAVEKKNSQPIDALSEEKKKKMQNAFKKLITQIKFGCNKQICFNKFCKKNVFSKQLLN